MTTCCGQTWTHASRAGTRCSDLEAMPSCMPDGPPAMHYRAHAMQPNTPSTAAWHSSTACWVTTISSMTSLPCASKPRPNQVRPNSATALLLLTKARSSGCCLRVTMPAAGLPHCFSSSSFSLSNSQSSRSVHIWRKTGAPVTHGGRSALASVHEQQRPRHETCSVSGTRGVVFALQAAGRWPAQGTGHRVVGPISIKLAGQYPTDDV